MEALQIAAAYVRIGEHGGEQAYGVVREQWSSAGSVGADGSSDLVSARPIGGRAAAFHRRLRGGRWR
jgi:hypothetical protein